MIDAGNDQPPTFPTFTPVEEISDHVEQEPERDNGNVSSEFSRSGLFKGIES